MDVVSLWCCMLQLVVVSLALAYLLCCGPNGLHSYFTHETAHLCARCR